jgi:hypothetical protein
LQKPTAPRYQQQQILAPAVRQEHAHHGQKNIGEEITGLAAQAESRLQESSRISGHTALTMQTHPFFALLFCDVTTTAGISRSYFTSLMFQNTG